MSALLRLLLLTLGLAAASLAQEDASATSATSAAAPPPAFGALDVGDYLNFASDDYDERQIDPVCRDKVEGEYFRQKPGRSGCAEVVTCTNTGQVDTLRCSDGLSFDVESQTCQWSVLVKNCDLAARKRVALPKFYTDEPICPEGQLACGDGACLKRSQFCDSRPDCLDESDEALCGPDDDPNSVGECDVFRCKKPICFCSESGRDIPDQMEAKEVPQLVTLTFEDAVVDQLKPIYDAIFEPGRLNPRSDGGCAIRGTFFVSHQYTNYSLVQELHRRGHEIGVHSVTHSADSSYWRQGGTERWAAEAGQARQILHKFAGIPLKDIRGFRSPFLHLGGNNQFRGLMMTGFAYDSSIVAGDAATNNDDSPVWPYTLHYRPPHRCYVYGEKCPSQNFDTWELALNTLVVERDGYLAECVTLDNCHITDPDQFFEVLSRNFLRHYRQNRAPFGIHLRPAFFQENPVLLDVLVEWIQDVLASFDDVFFVTMNDVLKFMQRPTPTRNFATSKPWQCRGPLDWPGSRCHKTNICSLRSPLFQPRLRHVMATCRQCPRTYPWLGNAGGR